MNGRKDRPMEKWMIEEIEKSRREMHEIVDRSIDALLLRAQGMEISTSNDRTRFLSADPAALKGEKPASITFANGRTMEATTWRNLAKAVLADCGSIPECRERLTKAKDIFFGRQRRVLGSDPSEMSAPLKIAEGLYFEGYSDTEYLFRNLTRVLDAAGYDYSGITFQLREAKLEEEMSSPTMTM